VRVSKDDIKAKREILRRELGDHGLVIRLSTSREGENLIARLEVTEAATDRTVAKLVSVTPGHPATLEEARPKIEDELKEKAAEDKVYEQVQKYDDVHDTGAPLAQAAKAAGVQVYTLGAMTKDGKINGQQVQGLTAKMIADAFSLSQGSETEVIDLGKGEYYALRVDQVAPSKVADLNEVRPVALHYYQQQELVKRLQAKAADLQARLKKGEPLDKVAASAGVGVQHLTGVSQSTAQQQQQLGERFLEGVFAGKPGDVFTAVTPIGVAVGRLTAVQPGQMAALVRDVQGLRPRLDMEMAQSELSDMVASGARTVIKPKVNAKLARQAVGVTEDADQASPGSGRAAKPAKAK